MPGFRRAIPASQLARDYGVSINEFATEVSALLAGGHEAAQSVEHGEPRRREICAAVSAAMIAALDASALSDEERARLGPLLNEVLMPFWTRHCGGSSESATSITTRSTHYLQRREPGSRVKTAVNIVTALLEALEVPEERRNDLARTLTASFAHRMVGDVYRINDLKTRFGIELSLLAALGALLNLSITYDSMLRVIRLV